MVKTPVGTVQVCEVVNVKRDETAAADAPKKLAIEIASGDDGIAVEMPLGYPTVPAGT
jgi:hypothetical protein